MTLLGCCSNEIQWLERSVNQAFIPRSQTVLMYIQSHVHRAYFLLSMYQPHKHIYTHPYKHTGMCCTYTHKAASCIGTCHVGVVLNVIACKLGYTPGQTCPLRRNSARDVCFGVFWAIHHETCVRSVHVYSYHIQEYAQAFRHTENTFETCKRPPSPRPNREYMWIPKLRC